MFSCNHLHDDKNTKIERISPKARTLFYTNVSYEKKKKAEKELMLDKLENGTDLFELRLWVKVEVYSLGQVLVIKKINNVWTCLDYSYIEKHDEWEEGTSAVSDFANFKIDTFWVQKKQPRTNWRSFFNEIYKDNILNLPSQDELKGWQNNVDDGLTFAVEYATNNKYRFYCYNCPDCYDKEFMECHQMVNILAAFSREFGLRLGFESKNNYKCCEKE